MPYIELTRGLRTLVDEDDYVWLSQYKWYAQKCGRLWYAARRITLDGGQRVQIYMHRLILRAPSNVLVDHINGDTLDNRKSNLRFADKAQQAWNMRRSDGSSRFKGVYFDKLRGKWCAMIRHRGKRHNLGYFDSEVDAALAYDRAAVRFFGEFARLNFGGTGDGGLVGALLKK